MDPLSALGIVAAVAQFLQFAGSLVSDAKQIYAKGSLVNHVECENATKRLSSLTKEIQGSMCELDSLRTEF